MTRSQAVILLVASAIAPASLPAQGPAGPELVTDRPDQTESAVVVPRGTLQTELGIGFARESSGPGRVDVVEAPGTLVRWGLLDRLELRFAWAGHVDVRADGPADAVEVSGPADPELGAKLSLLAAERGDASDLALLAHLSLPAGDDEIGSPGAVPSLRLNGAHELGEGVGLGWNAGIEGVSSEDARGEHLRTRFVYTAALGFDLAERWGAFVELFGDLPASDPERAAHSLDGGVTVLLTERLQLDFAAGAGLNAEAPDWFVGAGVSFRVPR
jgi:hypothetical protein